MTRSQSIKAGIGQVNITPHLGVSLQGHLNDRKANDIHDDLYAKCLVLDDGFQAIAFVVLDVIAIRGDDVAAIRRIVAEHTHIPAQNVMIACTHTHTAPAMFDMAGLYREDAYCNWLIPKVADAVRLAVRRLQPARVATGMGQEHTISFCRRFLMADGTVRFNPGRGNPDIRQVMGPIDPDVGIIYVETADGSPLASVVNFSLHYVGTDDSLAVSADYFAHFQDIMRRIQGPSFMTLLMNGAQGHTNNIDVSDKDQPGGHEQARQVARTLAGEVTRVIAQMRPSTTCTLGVAHERVTFKRKEAKPEDIQLAKELLDTDEVQDGPGPFSWVVGQPIPPSLRKVYALETIEVSKLPLMIETELQVLRVGDMSVVALPGEFFAEIGMAIKAEAKSPQTSIIGLANDFIGYVPTDKALLHEGGYETWTSRWSLPDVGAEGLFIKTASRLIEKLFL